MRLLLDEMISRAVAEQLRGKGWDVVAVQDADRAHLRGLDDWELFRAAQHEGRAVVTDNVPHFVACVRCAASEGWEHHGVLLFANDTFPRHRHEWFVGAMVSALEHELHARPETRADSRVVFLR